MRLFSKLRLPAAAVVAISAIAAFAPVGPASAAEMTPAERTAIEQVVRDYLLKNPEVLQEAIAELERRQQDQQRQAQEQAVASASQALFDDENNVVVGNPKGNVTVVEFFDYNCGYCKRALGDIANLVKDDPNLRVVLKDFPILRQESLDASLFALAARKQLQGEKFFDYHSRLLTSKGLVGKERAMEVAKEMGLDLARLQRDAASPELRDEIKKTLALGDQLSLTGTPAFVIGRDVVFGAVGLEPMQKAIASVRQCGRTTC
ncbi:DsbA family protein [Chelatococcus sp. GCM10030263]|uniref:DsbA family protein n=1 Tax=Chelatococcus sp. GCM10030263 TaxID=3273387 RepID=UPI003608D1AF